MSPLQQNLHSCTSEMRFPRHGFTHEPFSKEPILRLSSPTYDVEGRIVWAYRWAIVLTNVTLLSIKRYRYSDAWQIIMSYLFDGCWYCHNFQKYVFSFHSYKLQYKHCYWEVHQKHWKPYYLDLLFFSGQQFSTTNDYINPVRLGVTLTVSFAEGMSRNWQG